MSIKLPKRGFVFWPVGTGDSTTISINEDIILQIDLHHLSKSEDSEEPYLPIVDELKKILPKKDGKPYLAVFILTHPDEDHIKGFEELLKRVIIGEIWQTPRIFNEGNKDLCDDAKKFKEEINRRRELIIEKKGENIESGDRLIIIGHDDILKNKDYKDFPDKFKIYPGNIITKVDQNDVSHVFKCFIHAPFKDDSDDDRNNTSLSLQVQLISNDRSKFGKALFFGDREYLTIKKIFDVSIGKKNTDYLLWDLMLVAHHCSKKVMYWKDEDDENEKFRKDIMDLFKKYENDSAYLIASCESDFTDGEGDNPPHKKARNRYEEIVQKDHFICTHEHISKIFPEPVIFELSNDSFKYREDGKKDNNKELGNNPSIINSVKEKRNYNEPPSQKVTFGND